LKVPDFEDPQAEEIFGSVHRSQAFKEAFEKHIGKTKNHLSDPDWSHNTFVMWNVKRDGVLVQLKSKSGEKSEVTAYTCKRPTEAWELSEELSPSAILEQYLSLDEGTEEALGTLPDVWDEAAFTIMETLSQYNLEAPFTGTSKITGRVQFDGISHTASDPMLLQVDLPPNSQGIPRYSLRYSMHQGNFAKLESIPPLE